MKNLRNSIIDLAAELRSLDQQSGSSDAGDLARKREELLAELDRLILAARDPTHSLDEAILAILSSDAGRGLSVDMIAGELSDWVYARVQARLAAMVADGVIERTDRDLHFRPKRSKTSSGADVRTDSYPLSG